MQKKIEDPSGHAWVIDGYKCYCTTTDRPYKWVIMPPDSLSFYNNINYDYVLTVEEKEWRYPDVYEIKLTTHIRTYTITF